MQDGTLNLESYEVRNIEGAKKIVGSRNTATHV